MGKTFYFPTLDRKSRLFALGCRKTKIKLNWWYVSCNEKYFETDKRSHWEIPAAYVSIQRPFVATNLYNIWWTTSTAEWKSWNQRDLTIGELRCRVTDTKIKLWGLRSRENMNRAMIENYQQALSSSKWLQYLDCEMRDEEIVSILRCLLINTLSTRRDVYFPSSLSLPAASNIIKSTRDGNSGRERRRNPCLLYKLWTLAQAVN